MAKTPEMTVTTTPLPDGYVVTVGGDVDYSRSSELRAGLLGLLKGPVQRLVLDLGGVGYMDSSGVAVLVEALQIQRKRGNKLVLCNMQPKVRGIFEIARLHTVFTIVGDRAAAETV